MIYEDSRYSLDPVYRVQAADGVVRPTVYADGQPINPPFFNHVVVGGERFDTLAARYLGNAEFWWHIADANPEVFYPEDLIPGSIIRIPAD